jgi:hypothetical protein
MTKSVKIEGDWVTWDPITETHDGWYNYRLMKVLREIDERDGEPLFREEWRADEYFLNSGLRSMELRVDDSLKRLIRKQMMHFMLDCMRRDHQPGWAPDWHPLNDYIECECPASGPHDGHYVSEHRKSSCPGAWTMDPPCGGCVNCLAAQGAYYFNAALADYSELPPLTKLFTRRPKKWWK